MGESKKYFSNSKFTKKRVYFSTSVLNRLAFLFQEQLRFVTVVSFVCQKAGRDKVAILGMDVNLSSRNILTGFLKLFKSAARQGITMTTATGTTWRQRLEAYYYLCRFDKPVGTELVFWPTMWALWIAAEGMPPLHILLAMVFGTIFMRAAGCAINDFADRKVDGHVERTKTRPLATG